MQQNCEQQYDVLLQLLTTLSGHSKLYQLELAILLRMGVLPEQQRWAACAVVKVLYCSIPAEGVLPSFPW